MVWGSRAGRLAWMLSDSQVMEASLRGLMWVRGSFPCSPSTNPRTGGGAEKAAPCPGVRIAGVPQDFCPRLGRSDKPAAPGVVDGVRRTRLCPRRLDWAPSRSPHRFSAGRPGPMRSLGGLGRDRPGCRHPKCPRRALPMPLLRTLPSGAIKGGLSTGVRSGPRSSAFLQQQIPKR